jgi:hypothetical protein
MIQYEIGDIALAVAGMDRQSHIDVLREYLPVMPCPLGGRLLK